MYMYVLLWHYTLYCVSGLVFDESQPRDATLQPEKQKPKITLVQDPKQAKVHCHSMDNVVSLIIIIRNKHGH